MNVARVAQGLCLLLLFALPAFGTRPASPGFSPDDELPTNARLNGRTWALEAETFAVHVQQIDGEQRQAFIQKKTGWDVDPYAARPDARELFVTFLVRVENLGPGSLQFQPPGCWMFTDKKEVLHPVGLETLRGEYRMLDLELAPAYDRAGPAILEHGQLLAPGQSVAGLLVYHRFKPRTRAFRLELPLTMDNGEAIRMIVPYRRDKPEKRRGK